MSKTYENFHMLLFSQFNDSWLVVNFQPTLFAHSIWILIGSLEQQRAICLYTFFVRHTQNVTRNSWGNVKKFMVKQDVSNFGKRMSNERDDHLGTHKEWHLSIRCCKRLDVKFRLGHEARRKIGKCHITKAFPAFDVAAAINTEFETFMWIRV